MARAFELAELGRCGASPNPMVGAVVLDRRGGLAGEGYHIRYGGPHAEVEALAQAGERARGGTLYVTLEPCDHLGKTPPCSEAILAAGIARVVAAMADPNPEASGGGGRLRSAGVEVGFGLLEERARLLNRRWLRWAATARPWVTMKAAVSLDGRTATRTGESKWITGEAARRRGLELREEHDAVVVGVGTVLADNPQLTRRLGLNPGSPYRRIVLDSTLRTPVTADVVRSHPSLTLIAHTRHAPDDRRAALLETGVELLEVNADDRGKVDVQALLTALAPRPVAALLVEGGAEVHGSFVDAGVVDEAVFFVAPILIGGTASRPAVAGLGSGTLHAAPGFVIENVRPLGDDLEVAAVCLETTHVHWTG
jgi:diaminohydroxyphosphoribosylaminopyrimidine deaminase / 5-amino-6-(5-phosphoribosylamino)uracil reductase